MKPSEAGQLFKQLRAGFALAKVDGDTSQLWLRELRKLDHALGERAVNSLIASSKFWPAIAELYEQVEIARQQTARERRDRERHQADQRLDEMTLPPLREIPAV